jgi:hypothetical protein
MNKLYIIWIWLKYRIYKKSIFRSHTPEEAKAYSDFIDFYFEEVEIEK